MRISTQEEQKKQKFTRQEGALTKWCKDNDKEISERKIYKDDASGKSFERPAWKELEEDVKPGDTIIFKEISRFTRECENGLKKYMELMNKGINLVFIDNYTLNTVRKKDIILSKNMKIKLFQEPVMIDRDFNLCLMKSID